MPTHMDQVINILDLEHLDTNLYRGQNLATNRPRVFGGQVIAQAMTAAVRTVDERRVAHSMHSYFLRPGDPTRPIIYDVDPIRDGGSFSTRRVVAKQNGEAIFNAQFSFQKEQVGVEHQFDAPLAPDPESIESEFSFQMRMHEKHPERIPKPQFDAFEICPTHRLSEETREASSPFNLVWMKTKAKLALTPAEHQCLFAYMSDMYFMGTALLPHGLTWTTPNYQFASIDHSVWFHRPIRVDEWFLYSLDSPKANSGRGLNRGLVFSRDGELLASTMQEGLMRPGRKATK